MKDFSAIVLTSTGDYLLETEEQLKHEDKGVVLNSPYIMNEDEKAQEIQAERVFIPFSSVENIQHGAFKQETV